MYLACDIFVGTATLAMAVGLLLLGWWQLRAIRIQIERIDKSATMTEKANRAELILQLDKCYSEMMEARRDIWNIVQGCTKKYPTDKAKCYQAISTILMELRTSENENDLSRYYSIHQILDFGEMIAFLVLERELLTIDDVKGLWGTSLKSWAEWTSLHILDLQRDFSDAYVLLQKLAKEL